jgi:hypothetical protein
VKVSEKQALSRIEANNKIPLKNGTYPVEIVDVFLYNVFEEESTNRHGGKYNRRRYTQDDSEDQDVQIKVSLEKRPSIILKTDFRVYISGNSKFAKLIEGLLDIEPGEALCAYLLDDIAKPGSLTSDQARQVSQRLGNDLIGMKALITTDYNQDSGYVNIKSITPLPTPSSADDDLFITPRQSKDHKTARNTPGSRPGDEDYNFEGLTQPDEVPF